MDPLKIEKFQAMKRYKRKQFLPTLIQYMVSILMLGLFFSSLIWIPILFSNLKFFFFVYLPKMFAIVFEPKCLFIVCNIIIIFLVGESKFSKSFPSSDVYDEYLEQQKSLRRIYSGEAKEKESTVEKALVEKDEKDEEVEKEADEKGGGEEKEMQGECKDLEGGGEEDQEEEEVVLVREYEDLGGEEERGLPADELNKRVEDFIAKVNMQRRLEARMLVCYG